MDVIINGWAVLLAAISSMIVGSLWYLPAVLGRPWVSLAHVDMDKRPSGVQMAAIYLGAFIASFVTAYVLAHVAFLSNSFFHHSFLQDTFTTAFWLWLGFTATRIYVHDNFEGRPIKLTMITAGHELVTIMIMGLIIGLMGH